MGFLEEDFNNLNTNENYSLLQKAVDNLQETVSHLTEVAQIKVVESSRLEALSLYDYVEKAIYNFSAIAQHAEAIIYNEIDETICVRAIPVYLNSSV